MKYALFEFINEKSCEIGETRWIVREDHATFENTSWDTEKEIMVTWPTEFNKLSKKDYKGFYRSIICFNNYICGKSTQI